MEMPQFERLQQKHKELQEQFELLSKKIPELRKAHGIETDFIKKQRVEKQIEQAEIERTEIETQLETIEIQLSEKDSQYKKLTHAHTWEKIGAFVFGVVFIGIMLSIALFIPVPTDFQKFVFRIVLALAAAGIGAVVPGFLQVQLPPYIRAGGAIALFIIIYWFNPPALFEKSSKINLEEQPIITPTPTVSQESSESPGAVVQTMKNSPYGTQIVAEHLVVNFVSSFPEPQLKVETVAENTLLEGRYQSRFRISVVSPFPIPNLYIAVHAKTLLDMEVIPQRIGLLIQSHSGRREGYIFTNFPNFSGELELRVTSERPETFRVEVEAT